jgi:hypothetical protein
VDVDVNVNLNATLDVIVDVSSGRFVSVAFAKPPGTQAW